LSKRIGSNNGVHTVKRKKRAIFLSALALIILGLCIYIYWPVKFATHKEDIDQTQPYIIVKSVKVTGFNWAIVTDKSGAVRKESYPYVTLVGNDPANCTFDFEAGNNLFVCYGSFDDTAFDQYYDPPYFRVTSWDIVYPIDHNWLLPAPKQFMCRFDLS
jgi:hypothetical protein